MLFLSQIIKFKNIYLTHRKNVRIIIILLLIEFAKCPSTDIMVFKI